MAKQYNNYLANFLATGDPNGEGLAQWTNWTPESKNSMVFDGTETDAIVELKDVSTTYEQIIAQMEADTSISPELDRKSTRLNSSHVSISYAVFCLKKKIDIE